MNFSIIKRVLGWILLFEAIFFLVPMITAIVYWESAFFSFMITMFICIIIGILCLIGKPKNNTIYAKEGFVIVALCWIVISIFGALPFVFSGTIPNYIDALFETVSGFTTTGASIISADYGNGLGVEALPKSILMWRSFTHWVGGMGVLVFIIAFLPLSGARNVHIMKAESPGPVVSKLVPKVRTTALILYAIYFLLTLIQFLLLLAGNMSVFDALNTAFATAGTGGFAIKSDGFAGYSTYLQWVVTIFMLIFSINFNSYYMLFKRRWKEILTTEVKWFLIIVGAAIALVTANVFFSGSLSSWWDSLTHSAFSVATVVSTTGFATENFDLWPAFSKVILVLLMFMGACAGSTGGGMKVSRFLILGKSTSNEMRKMLHPKQIRRITVDGKVVEDDVVRAVYGFVLAYVLIFIVSLLLISLEGKDMVTNFTSVTATLNNIGPGLSEVGPAGSYAGFTWGSKLVFIFDMLAGRLELFPMIFLLAPTTWKK